MKLASYLKKTGISQAAFARLIGASPSAVTRWITGSRRPTLDQLRAISAATRGEIAPEDFYDLACAPLDWRCRVRAWAIQNNCEMREIARKAKLHPSSFARMMSGVARPSMRAARNIVAASDTTIRLEAFLEPRPAQIRRTGKTAGKGAPALHAKRARLHAGKNARV